jgi:hypothetical protein
MASSVMLRRVALVRTDVSEELSASIVRVTRIGELGTTLAVTSDRRTRRNFTEEAILHSHRRENLIQLHFLFCLKIVYIKYVKQNCCENSLFLSRQAI